MNSTNISTYLLCARQYFRYWGATVNKAKPLIYLFIFGHAAWLAVSQFTGPGIEPEARAVRESMES